MKWDIQYLPEVEKDLKALSHNQVISVRKALEKVRQNPLPQEEGGYGKPLGHKSSTNLTGFLKIKLRKEGIRIVYTTIHTDTAMLIIVIGIREDNAVYEAAQNRIIKNKL